MQRSRKNEVTDYLDLDLDLDVLQFNTPGGVRRTGLCVRNRKVNY